MNTFNRRSVLALTIGSFMGLSSVQADPSGSAFLRIDPSPRSQALGQASDVVSTGAQAPGANPANLLQGRSLELFSSYSSLTEDLGFVHVGASGIWNKVWSAGVFFSRFSSGDQERRDSSGNLQGTFTAADVAFGASLARRLGDNLSVGVTFKGLRSEIDTYSTGTDYAVDAGAHYVYREARYPIEIGASVRNMGPGVTFVNESDPLPTTLGLSLALNAKYLKPVLTVHRLIPDKQTDYGFGLEYSRSIVAARIGYVIEGGESNLAAASGSAGSRVIEGFSTGFGIHLNNFALDYALITPTADLGVWHRAALTFRWGGDTEASDPVLSSSK